MDLVFVFFLLFTIPFTCEGIFQNCRIFPTDVFIEVGSGAQIVCQCDSFRDSEVVWTLNGDPVDENLSETVNSTHAVLSLKHFTLPLATVECRNSETKQILAGTIVRTYSKPTNISCVLHYKNLTEGFIPSLFTCSWDHNSDDTQQINYTVMVESAEVFTCVSRVTSCTKEDVDESGEISLVGNIMVTVKAETAQWTTSSLPTEFDPITIVKMTPPSLSTMAFSDHLLVSWDSVFFELFREFSCQLKYRELPMSSSEEKPEQMIPTCIGCQNASIESLESCTSYNISVRCALYEPTWSDWSREQTVLTKMNHDHVNLDLWRKVSEVGKDGLRKVQLMWRSVPPACAETVTYSFKETSLVNDTTEGNYTSCSSSACTVQVDVHAHRIHLRLSQNETVIAEDFIYVPAVTESLPRVTDIQTSAVNDVILVKWRAPEQPVRGYMIDWSHRGNRYQWMRSECTNATLSDLVAKKPYNITVTPLLDEKTGHSTQVQQVCSGFNGPGKVHINPVQASDRSATVSWVIKSEGECSGVVVENVIFYKEESQHSPSNYTVDGKMFNVSLKDLTPATQYSIYVKAKAKSGETTSMETLFKTSKYDQRLLDKIIVWGLTAFGTLLVLGLVFAVTWKKLLKTPVPDPSVSSVAEWLLQCKHKGGDVFQSFTNPFESFSDQPYTEEAFSTLTGRRGSHPQMHREKEKLKTAIVLTPNVKIESPDKPADAQLSLHTGETTSSLFNEDGSGSPYRSQTSAESLMSTITREHCESSRVPGKLSPKSVYVSLHMFEQTDERMQ